MKIYTRTGDQGETGLFGGQRVAKDHERVEAYGAVDELNSVLGLTHRACVRTGLADLADALALIQRDLFAVGAHLATPRPEDGGRPQALEALPPLPEDRVGWMERWIDAAEAALPPLRHFVLPGGSEPAAWLHLARTVCRRAERRVVHLGLRAHLPDGLLIYLNRLSDLLFVMARWANHRLGTEDRPWIPGAETGATAPLPMPDPTTQLTP